MWNPCKNCGGDCSRSRDHGRASIDDSLAYCIFDAVAVDIDGVETYLPIALSRNVHSSDFASEFYVVAASKGEFTPWTSPILGAAEIEGKLWSSHSILANQLRKQGRVVGLPMLRESHSDQAINLIHKAFCLTDSHETLPFDSQSGDGEVIDPWRSR